MTLSRLVYLTCDGCGYPAGSGDDMQDTGAAARRRARQFGWIRRGRRDLCPNCQSTEPS